MTGYSIPPDHEAADAETAASTPMAPDEPGLPEHDSVSPAFDDGHDDPDTMPGEQTEPAPDDGTR